MENKAIKPENHTSIEFLIEQVSRIIESVAENDNVAIVNKNSKPHNVIIYMIDNIH